MFVIIIVVLIYFSLLMGISYWTGRRATNATFYRADRRSPWYMVAFGMVGASISGVTFVSVPGMVINTQMTYLQICLGFILGYVAIAFVLLPIYYRLNLTSIYSYLKQRFGKYSYKTGASFFLLSKMAGSSLKFYVVCIILQRFVFTPLGVPFFATVVLLVALIWLYTRQGGIKTLVWTDSLQTVCLFGALLLIIYYVMQDLNLTMGDAVVAVKAHEWSQVFVFDDWMSKQYFWKQFVSGIFIVIVMTGLDQDMMQKNLTCKNLRDAQKDMCTYGVAFVPVNLLFLSLGVLLVMQVQQQGGALPVSGDELLPQYVEHSGFLVTALFTLGIVAASFSSADSALTSMTTIFCVDICDKTDEEQFRKRTHLLMCGVFVVFILLFKLVNSTSLIDAIYIVVSYTYGPLLGLFAFGLLTNRAVNDRLVPYIAVVSPLMCYLLDLGLGILAGYHMGYELLLLNGLLTYVSLWMTGSHPSSAGRNTL